MDEEEDWDAPSQPAQKPASPQRNSVSTSEQTLKVTDGYKYSYEALRSPANIEDWVEPPSYGGSRRSQNGFGQRDREGGRPFRNNRNNGERAERRFNPIKRNRPDYTNEVFGTPKSDRFPRSIPTPAVDWDAPSEAAYPMNGSWNPTNNAVHTINPVPMNVAPAEENWDDDEPAVTSTPISQNHATNARTSELNSLQNNSVPMNKSSTEENWDDEDDDSSTPATKSGIPMFTPKSMPPPPAPSQSQTKSNISTNNDEEENWDDDEPTESSSKDSKKLSKVESSTPSSRSFATSSNAANEENWDDDDDEPSDSKNSSLNTSAGKIPNLFAPSQSNGDDQRKGDSSKYNNSRGFGDQNRSYDEQSRGFGESSRGYGESSRGFGDSNRSYDSGKRGFDRDPFVRHSRGNTRYNPYERNDRRDRGDRGDWEDRRGRGGRGGRGRGGRGGRDRDSFGSSYDSRDRSRGRDDWRDRSFSKGRNDRGEQSNRYSYQPPPPPSKSNEPEEDWDEPSGFAQKPSTPAPPPDMPTADKPPPPPEEESWD